MWADGGKPSVPDGGRRREQTPASASARDAKSPGATLRAPFEQATLRLLPRRADLARARPAPGELSSSAIKTRRKSIAKSRLYENLGHKMGVSTVMKSPKSDLVIVAGAGPAGATAARRLALAGRPVQLLDRRTFPRQKP